MAAAKFFSLAFLASSIFPSVLAQTYTSCNPLQGTCPADPGLTSSVLSTDFTQSQAVPAGWSKTNAGSVNFDSNGANFVLAAQGDSPTFVSNDYIFFGSVEWVMKSATGQGIVSSLILLSDDLDELDWEFIGGNNAQVQSNYFGKGDTTTYNRAAWHNVATPENTWHTYKFDWTPQAVTFSIDGTVVRTLNYADAQGGTRFPQTPMKIKFGIWAGGDPSNSPGTIQWAGGLTNYGAGPFTMTVKSVNIVNYSPGSSYTYGDTSGSYQSIKIAGGTLMSNAGAAGNQGSSAAQSSQGSPTTSLSFATAPTVNPVTAAPSTTQTANTSQPTGSQTQLPTTLTTQSSATTGSTSSSTSPITKSSNAAVGSYTPVGAGIGGAVLALAMAVFA